MGNTLPVKLPRELRQRQTEAEKILWYKLRNRQLDGAKFRRQHPIGNYIVDFACLEKNLIIEIDGSQHNKEQAKEKDEQRTLWLEKESYKIIRFWNSDILNNIEGVLLYIKNVLDQEFHPHLCNQRHG